MNAKRYKYFVRIIAALSFFTIGLLLFLNILMSVGGIDFQVIDNLQTANIAVEIFVGVLGFVGPVSVMALWIVMLYHWGTHKFKSTAQKKLWLAVLLLGNIVTSPIYYVVVVEMHRTVRDADRGE